MTDEEKKAIEYLESRLYGNEGCKFIDVAQSDLRIFLKLVENLQKDIESWKKYCDEQENDITLKNNKICDLEFQVEKQSKEIEHQIEKRANQRNELAILNAKQIEFNKLVNTVNSYKGQIKKLRDKGKELIFEKQQLTSALLDSTPNDKIKALIEELEKLNEEATGNGFGFAIHYLKSLLKEE